MVDYSKWDNLDFSSDSDDCHPNIDKDTWKRLKARQREEQGIVKKEVILIDKWNSTSVNTKRSATSPPRPSKQNEAVAVADSSSLEPAATDSSPATAAPSEDASVGQQERSDDLKEVTDDVERLGLEHRVEAVAEALDYDARSNPFVFLENHREELEKFARIKSDKKSERFLKKNGHLIHEAAEGYLITRAVDMAVDGDEAGKCRVARRCLQIHNLVLSCKQANVKAETGAEMFFERLTHPKMEKEYRREFEKQYRELVERIEERRLERVEEMQAPVGPGGLDPTEVLNTLPEEMQQAFIDKDEEQLKAVLATMDPQEAHQHMERCISSGLWVDQGGPPDDGEHVDSAENNLAAEELQ